jgi:restriction system protein
MQIGDLVALPLKTEPAVAFGRVSGDYRYNATAPPSARHQRPVDWIRDDVARLSLDQDLLYSLGASMTVCRIKRNNAEARVRRLLAE